MLKRVLLALTLFATVANFSGCIFLVAGGAAAGTATWLSQKVTQNVNSPLEKTTKAARAALKDQGIEIYKETTAPDVTQLLAKDPAGKQVWVDLRPVDAKITEIAVRVGYVNGEKNAADILGKIVSKTNLWI